MCFLVEREHNSFLETNLPLLRIFSLRVGVCVPFFNYRSYVEMLVSLFLFFFLFLFEGLDYCSVFVKVFADDKFLFCGQC